MTIDRFYVTSVSPLLAVCGSLKPASGHKEPSACRELLRLALAPVTSIYPSIETLDLREAGLPAFDGREPWEYGHPALVAARAVVEVAAGYVFSVPAYWGGIGAAFKNFIETVCGPGYGGRSSPFADKPAAVLIVGSDPRVAHAAEPQIESLLDALGLLPVRSPILVGDPHELVDTARAVQELTAAAASVALALPASLALKRKAER
jgi:NAD(P)H-dependent FMN reductase